MSWYIKTLGTRKNVKAQLLANTQLPAGLKADLIAGIDDVTPESKPFIRIEGNGHIGGGYTSIGRLEFESLDVAQEAPAETQPAAPEPEKEKTTEQSGEPAR